MNDLPGQLRTARIDASPWLTLTVIGSGLIAATAITYLAGGTHRAFPHLYYLPILYGAYVFGFRGGVLTAIVASIACGPVMPLNVEAGTMQSAENWLARGTFFLSIGSISGIGAHMLRRRLLEKQRLHEEAIVAFVKTVDAKSPYTARHSERVAELATATGKAIGMSESEVDELRWAALLHDVGKLWVPDDILNKQGPLVEAEWEAIRAHPIYSAEFVRGISSFRPYYDVARHHHERFDGKGYPDGLSGQEIPLHARVLAVADAFEAMTSDRPYRPGMSFREAKSELVNNAGTQFDPTVVGAFVESIESDPSERLSWRIPQRSSRPAPYSISLDSRAS